MSFSDTDPIASDIGHGAPGLRDNLKTFGDLVDATACQKQAFVAFEAGRLMSGWTADATAGVYSIAAIFNWGGLLRDVVGIETSAERLTRVESADECRATAGTFYFDPDQLPYGYHWDDGTLWDSGALWAPAELYVHLTGGTDPDTTPTIAKLGFYYGTDAVVQPTLGPEKLTDGGLDSWASSSDLDDWTEAEEGAGGGSVARGDALDPLTSYSAMFSGELAASGGYGISQGSLPGIGGATYRLSGRYKTDATNPAGIEARIRVGFTDYYLENDGRNTTSDTTGFALTNTTGASRRFTFDFVCPDDTSALDVLVSAWNSTAGALTAAGVWFDELSLKRVFRYERYESRLAIDSIPQIDQKRSDAFFGPVARGAGTLSLINGDGSLEAVFGSLDWINREFSVRVGGRFPNGGNEVMFENSWVAIVGIVTPRVQVNDSKIMLPFEDSRAQLAVQLPPNTVDAADDPNLLESDRGRRRALFFGEATNAKPVCVDTDGYGTFELIDMSEAPAALTGSETATFRCYLDEDSAVKEDLTRAALLTVTVDADGRTTPTDCPKAYEVASDKNVFECSFGGATQTVYITAGIYTPGQLAALLKAGVDTKAGDSNTTVSFSSSTGKYTVSRPSGTFQIKSVTGTYAYRGMYATLGFTGTADYTGALTYTSDSAVFTSVKDSAIRFSGLYSGTTGTGFLDDSSGTYTGTAGAPIILGPDIVRCLMIQWGGIDSTMVDETTFVAGRSENSQPLAVYLGIPSLELESLANIIERVCTSCNADVIFEGGRFYWSQRTTEPTGTLVSLSDDDYLSFTGTYDATDLYQIVRVGYRRDHGSGEYKTTQTTTASVKLRFGRPDQRTFYTDIPGSGLNEAAARKAQLVSEASVRRRRFTVTVKGKLFRLGLGRMVYLTRAKGLDANGSLDSVLCRILSKRDNAVTHETTAEMIEVV